MIIAISGSVGTGKTTLAKRLAKSLNYTYLDVNKLIKVNKIFEGYDRKRKCSIVDTKKLNRVLINLIKHNKNMIIDSHLSHYLPKRYIDLCIITKCNLKTLEKRLKKRDYSKNKIRENLEAEIFDVCYEETKEQGHKIKVVDTSNRYNLKGIIKSLNLKIK